MNIIEVKGDLFAEPYAKGEDVYVHCVSSDFALGAGIAKTFREKFPIFVERKQEMIRKFPRAKLSGLFSVATEGHLIVNLVTKKNYWDKPTYDSMETSLPAVSHAPPAHHACPYAAHRLWTGQVGVVKGESNDRDYPRKFGC